MLDRDQLEAFAAVVELLSFERAAEKLHVTRGAISQRVKALEEAVATSLLVRQKPLALTAAGSVLLKHVAALRLLEADTFGQICARGGGARTAPPLAVGVDAFSVDTWFGSVARRLMERETVELEVVVIDDDPAFPALVRGEVVGCVSTIARAASGCVAVPIGDMSYRCVAAPAFMQRRFTQGFSLQAATKAPAVLLSRRAGLLERYLEAAFGVTVGRYSRHFLPSPAAQLDAVLAGVGYGPLPEPSVREHLARGTLVDVMQDFRLRVTLYWHHWRTAPPVCQAIGVEIVDFGLKMLRRLEDAPLAVDQGQA